MNRLLIGNRTRVAASMLAFLLLVLWSFAGTQAEAKSNRCLERGSVTLAANSIARVYKTRPGQRGTTVLCLQKTGKSYEMDYPAGGERLYPAVALNGPLLGFATEGSSDIFEAGAATIFVTNLRLDKPARGFAPPRGIEVATLRFTESPKLPYAVRHSFYGPMQLGSLVVTPTGGVAWIGCIRRIGWGPEDNGNPEPGCVRTGGNDRVYKLNPYTTIPVVLDGGKQIDPRSLKYKNGKITWTKRGKRQSSTLK